MKRSMIALLSAAAVGLIPTSAWAAATSITSLLAQVDARPPAPSDPGSPPTFLYYIIGFALGAIAIGLAIMPSKRSHHD